MKESLISVIMGVHNEKEEYLRVAIDSILNQAYSNFEFIIIDDYSDAECEIILKEIAQTDNRIRLIRNHENCGLTKSLNIGLSYAEGDFIARMDADDYSTNDRFEKQLSFFKDHPEIDLLGGGVVSFGNEQVFMSPVFGYTNEQAQCDLFFQSTLCHPSVMIRKSFLDKYDLKYDENVKKGQDYDMWERCSVYGKLAVMTDVVLYYRTHGAQITSTSRGAQDVTAKMVRLRRLSRLGLEPSELEYRCHLMLLGDVDRTISKHEVEMWMYKVLEANKISMVANQMALTKNLRSRYVLFKARNGHRSFFDIFALAIIALSRYKMRNKLTYVSKIIDSTLK